MDATISNAVVLPAGVTIAGMRETTQTSLNGQVLSGQKITLALPSGATTSVFVPDSLLGQNDAITAVIAKRVADVSAIANASNGS